MSSEKFVVSVGSLNVDINISVKEIALIDEESSIIKQEISSGGCAGNIASGLGRLGVKTYFWGNIGNDSNTNLLLDDFKKDKVNFSYAKKIDSPNNTCYSIVDLKGNRTMYSINNTNFKSSEFPKEFLSTKCEFIVFSSLTSEKYLEEYCRIASKAKKNGTKIVFSPGNIYSKLGFEKLKKILGITDYLFISYIEFKQIGLKIPHLLKLVPFVIITRGAEGVDLFERNSERKKYKANKVKKIIDTTGAGDNFLAGTIAYLTKTGDLYKGIEFGQKIASESIKYRGARNVKKLSI